MSADYSDPLLRLKEWIRRYSDDMRNHHFEDARYDAIQIAKFAMTCLDAAKVAGENQLGIEAARQPANIPLLQPDDYES